MLVPTEADSTVRFLCGIHGFSLVISRILRVLRVVVVLFLELNFMS